MTCSWRQWLFVDDQYAFDDFWSCSSCPVANRALTERHTFTDDVIMEIRISADGVEPKSVRIDPSAEMRDRQIDRERDYYDTLMLMEQLGVAATA